MADTTKYTWREVTDHDSDDPVPTWSCTTDEHNVLTIVGLASGFLAIRVNGMDTDSGIFADGGMAVRWAEENGDRIAAEQLAAEK